MEGHDTFSVGVLPTTNEKRREVFDGIALLAGHRGQPDALVDPRRENHVECMERLIASTWEIMVTFPAQFAMLFGEGGDPKTNAEAKLRWERFAAFVARLKDRGA